MDGYVGVHSHCGHVRVTFVVQHDINENFYNNENDALIVANNATLHHCTAL